MICDIFFFLKGRGYPRPFRPDIELKILIIVVVVVAIYVIVGRINYIGKEKKTKAEKSNRKSLAYNYLYQNGWTINENKDFENWDYLVFRKKYKFGYIYVYRDFKKQELIILYLDHLDNPQKHNIRLDK